MHRIMMITIMEYFGKYGLYLNRLSANIGDYWLSWWRLLTGRALCLKDLQFEVNRLQLMWGRQVAKTRHKLSHFCSSWALALAVMDGVG